VSVWNMNIAGWRPVYWLALNYMRFFPANVCKEYLRHGVVGHSPRYNKFTNKDGITFDLDISEYVQEAIFCFHYYESEDIAIFRKFIHSDSIVFDVGANVGQYTLLADKLVGDEGAVYAFEPSPDVLGRLQNNLEGNHVRHTELVCKAVAASNGVANFYPSNQSSNQGVGSLLPDRGDMRVSEAIEVEVITLDAFCDEKGIEKIDVLKIDVEGFDLDVLQGANKVLVRSPSIVVLAEVEPINLAQRGLTATDFLQFMTKRGFNAYYANGKGRLVALKGNHLPTPNLFFLRPEYHVDFLRHG